MASNSARYVWAAGRKSRAAASSVSPARTPAFAPARWMAGPVANDASIRATDCTDAMVPLCAGVKVFDNSGSNVPSTVAAMP